MSAEDERDYSDVVSAAQVEGEIELMIVPRSGQPWPPRAYLIGPVAAATLHRTLAEAISDLAEWTLSHQDAVPDFVMLSKAEAKALREHVNGDSADMDAINSALAKIGEYP